MLLTRQFRRQSKTRGRNGWWRRCGWRGEDAEEEIADLIHDTSTTMRSWCLTNQSFYYNLAHFELPCTVYVAGNCGNQAFPDMPRQFRKSLSRFSFLTSQLQEKLKHTNLSTMLCVTPSNFFLWDDTLRRSSAPPTMTMPVTAFIRSLRSSRSSLRHWLAFSPNTNKALKIGDMMKKWIRSHKLFLMISQLFFDSSYWLVPQNQRWSL